MNRSIFGFAFALSCGLAGTAMAADAPKPVAKSVSTPSAAAGPDLVGDVSFYGGAVGASGDTYGLFGGNGRFVMGMGGGLGFQGDVYGDTLFSAGEGLTDFGLTGHLISRGMGGALGVKLGVENIYMSTGMNVGLEGQIYSGNITLGADINDLFIEGSSLLQVRGLARLYVDPNTRLQFDAAWWDSDGSTNLWTFAGAASHRLMGTPVDLGARLRYDSFEGTNVFAGTVGLTFNFDARNSTIQSHDRAVPFDRLGLGGLF